MSFKLNPQSVIFSITNKCNLNCLHCTVNLSNKTIKFHQAKKFIEKCAKAEIKRIGFTGGEPFLENRLLCHLVKTALKHDFIFDRVTTNGVWHKNVKHLKAELVKLKNAGYDGDIFVSFDCLHKSSILKVTQFIKQSSMIFNRPDVVSFLVVKGFDDEKNQKKIDQFAEKINARFKRISDYEGLIASNDFFIKVFYIDITHIKTESRPSKKWFDKEICSLLGDVFFVEADGSVKLCCGYAADICDQLTIGNINQSIKALIKNGETNSFIRQVFGKGLIDLRKKIEKRTNIKLDKTDNNCFFCWYILTNIPKKTLEKCLSG